jgi:hypothetical protein
VAAIALFKLGDEAGHHRGDVQCPACSEEYPEPCRCGGLIHATEGETENEEGNVVLTTGCDRCGRSEDQLDEI